MQRRLNNVIGLLLAVLLFASSLAPTSAWAEAQMRCVGVSSVPCVRLDLPASGLTRQRVNRALMACCRAGKPGCAAMPGCPLPGGAPVLDKLVFRFHSAASAPHCLVSVSEFIPAPAAPAHRSPWLLRFSPALAPPPAVTAPILCIISVPRWTYTAAHSSYAAPTRHGLRAPPA